VTAAHASARGAIVRAKSGVLLPLGVTRPTTDPQRRTVAVVRGAVSAVLARGVSLVTSLAVVPLAVGYLGGERYGVWATIAALRNWLLLVDLGLGNELTTALAAHRGSSSSDTASSVRRRRRAAGTACDGS
jgi:hypothetical protein